MCGLRIKLTVSLATKAVMGGELYVQKKPKSVVDALGSYNHFTNNYVLPHWRNE